MDDATGRPPARAPRPQDLARICQALNDAGARYVLIGGFAVIAHGGGRTTRVVSKSTLIRTKQTLRPTDIADRQFLEALLDEEQRSG